MHAQDFTTLKGHGGPIMGIAVSKTDQVATASFDNSVGLWADRAPTWLEGHVAAVNVVRFLEDGSLVSAGDDNSVFYWQKTADAPVLLGTHTAKVVALDYHETSRTVASASWDGTIGLFPLSAVEADLTNKDGQTSRATHLRHGAGVNAVVISDDATRVYAASVDGSISVWSLEDGTSRPLVRHGFGVNELVLNEAEGWLAYGAVDGGTRVIDINTGAQIADFTLERRPILSMAFHADTQQIAVGDGQGYIMMLDTAVWRIARDFRATGRGPVWALAFSQDGAVIHAGGLDDVVYSWPVALLGEFDPGISGARSFLRDAASMPNGERQFMRKCSVCHALEPGPSRKAGPSLHGIFGRRAGTFPGYSYSEILDGSDIIWNKTTIDALFDQGPDHFIPGSKMPMQVIAGAGDRNDLIEFLERSTRGE